MKLNPSKTGLVLGVMIGGAHVVWATLVALGLAQNLLDFIFSVHMVSIPFQVTGFDITQAVVLVVVTFVVGNVVGYIFANVWNKVQK